MAKLRLSVKRKEQRGADTFLSLRLSEDDGPQSIPFEVTLHNVDEGKVDVKNGGMCIMTKEGAPVLVNFGKPAESII